MPIRIGANPIGWSNDDLHDIGGDTPLEVCLAEASEAGFVGMELGHKFPRQPQALQAALAPFGMACISGWYSAQLLTRDADAEMQYLRPHLDLLKAMGSDVLVLCETSNAIHGDRSKPLSLRPRLRGGDWAEWGRRLTQLADHTLAEGVRVAYHHHIGTIVETPDDIDALMASTGPSVALLLDTGHATWGGADPVELARKYRTRIGHFHAKDVRKNILDKVRAKDSSFLDAILGEGDELGVYTVPGDGMVDYAAVFEQLQGYSGWVVVEAEQDPKKANPLAYAKKGVAHLKAALREAGLT